MTQQNQALGARLAILERKIKTLTKVSPFVNASVENTSVSVYDDTGSLRALIGQQADGTTAVNVTNGPAPAAPTPPVLASILGGVSAAWDGAFADGSATPLDFARVEIHASGVDGFTPDATTLQGTLESPRGGTLSVPCSDPVYVVLLARNTSGTASAAFVQAGPCAPAEVVADDVLDGIITTVKLADDAVTSAKVATGAIDSDAIAAAAVTAAALGAGAVTAAALAAGAVTPTALDTGAVTATALAAGAVTGPAIAASAVTAGSIAAGAVTAGKIAANAVTASTIAANAITAGAIAANAVTAGTIAAGVVDATALAAGAVTTAKLAAGAVTASTIAANTIVAGNIAAGAISATALAAGSVTTTALAALSVTGAKIAANTITAGNIAAGSISTDRLTVGVASNYVPDPSFEGAWGAAAVAAAGVNWALDPTKASSGTNSVKVNATSASAATTDLALIVALPVAAGDQLYLQTDWAATVMTGTSGSVGQKMFAAWKNAAGTIISYSVLTAPLTLDGTWRTMSGTFIAPAGAVTCDVHLQILSYTAVTAWYDNVIVRPVLGGTQIQGGAITAAHLTATAIDGKTITGATIQTSATTTGARLVLDGPSDTFKLYDSSARLAAYMGPGAPSVFGDTSPLILSYEVGGSLFSALWNGSCLVGLGDPVANETVLQDAGGVIASPDGSVLVSNIPTTALPVPTAIYMEAGTSLTAAPGSASLPRIFLASNLLLGSMGPADVIASSAIIRADPSNPLTLATWLAPTLVSGWSLAGFSGDQTFQVRLDAFDNVILDGEMTTPAVAAGTTTSILTTPLPAAYRPKKHRRFPIYQSSGVAGTYATGIIHSDGNLFVQNPVALAAGAIISFGHAVPLGNVA